MWYGYIEWDCDNPLDNYLLKSTLKGIDRLHSSPPNRKALITPQLLLNISRLLGISVFDRMLWASALIKLFGTFRKSNLMSDGTLDFDSSKQFIRSHFVISSAGLSLMVKWSKTNQYKKQCHVKRIPRMKGHPLCPVTAIEKAFASGPLIDNSRAFLADKLGTPMTVKRFTRRLKTLVSACGLDPTLYASHLYLLSLCQYLA